METRITEIADGVFQLTTEVPDVPVAFTQYLLTADEPMLFHTGLRHLFPDVSDAVAQVRPVESLRWIAFGHFEADECGSMNQWLRAAPDATIAHTVVGVLTSIGDLAEREPRSLNDGEVLDLGGRSVRHLTTPHLPHGWDAGLLYDETTKTLFCGDLFTCTGPFAPSTADDILERAIEAEDMFGATVVTPETGRMIRRLAELDVETLAPMHAPAYTGDCTAALLALAADCDRRLEAAS